MPKFELLHGTSCCAASSIQGTGFLLTTGGFFGPAAYFYENNQTGQTLVRAWISKKISHGHIANIDKCAIIECEACCHDGKFLNGGEKKYAEQMEKRANKAYKIAWKDIKENYDSLSHSEKLKKVDEYVNNARNYLIMLWEKQLNQPVDIYKGYIKPSEPCIVVRNRACLTPPPYIVKDYNGKAIC